MNEMSEELMKENFVASVVSPRVLAKTSKIAIPDVQRGLVWNPTQIAELWKSIFEGYPIGALTVYRQKDNWQLIDGQQRWHAIKLGLHPDEKQKAMTILWTVWEKNQDESWNFVHLMVSTRRHPWGFVWKKPDDRLERLPHSEMIEAWDKMLPKEKREDPFELPTLAAAQKYFLEDNSKHKWIPLHELLSEENATNDNIIETIRNSEQVKAWRERVESPFIPLIRFNLKENVTSDKSDRNRIHELFTRINKGGTEISTVDYTYSTLCSYLGNDFKNSINTIAENFMPPNRVARLYARLKYAEDPEKRTSGILHEPPHASYWNGKEYDREIGEAIKSAKEMYTLSAKEMYTLSAEEMYKSIGIPQTVYLQAVGDEWLTVVVRCIRRFSDIIQKGVNKEKDLLCMLPYVVCRDPSYHAKFCERFDEALKNAKPKSLIEMLAIGVAYAACYSIETGMYPVSSRKEAVIMSEYPYEDEWLHVLCDQKNEPLLHFLQRSYLRRMLQFKCGFYPHETATWGEAMNRPWDIDHIVPQSRWWLMQPEEQMFREALPNKQILYYRRNREKHDEYIGVSADDNISPVDNFCYRDAVLRRKAENVLYYGWAKADVFFRKRPERLTTKTKDDNKEKYNKSLQDYKIVVNSRFSAMVQRLFEELPLEELIRAINALPESAPCCLQLPIKLWSDYLQYRKDLTWCSVRHDQSKQQIIETKDFYHSLCDWLAVGKEENHAFRCVCWHLSDAQTLHAETGDRRLPDQTASEWRNGASPDAPRNDWWVEASFRSLTCNRSEEVIEIIKQYPTSSEQAPRGKE
ncbi:MAG: DUF262 domain-containing protein [Akkermansia muciniphila]|nr:DUF262 domain-containing protein [Akkermansia muciniphila]